MNIKAVEDIAAAVLYEGYLLYPYRASAIKNRQRWNFGVLYPPVYVEQQFGSDASRMHTECLLRGYPEAQAVIRVRFLHLIARTAEGQDWQGAIPREIEVQARSLAELISNPVRRHVVFEPMESQQHQLAVVVEIKAELLSDNLCKLAVTTSNITAFDGSTRDDALMRSLVSTHTILTAESGEFVSLLEPPEELRSAAEACHQVGTWPVLAGDMGQPDAMLSSPIILYDYPKIAPESPGALFDGTEIDEILTLRIMTLTEEEKREMAADERTREILERTERLSPEEFMKMHGVFRNLYDAPLETL